MLDLSKRYLVRMANITFVDADIDSRLAEVNGNNEDCILLRTISNIYPTKGEDFFVGLKRYKVESVFHSYQEDIKNFTEPEGFHEEITYNITVYLTRGNNVK